MFSLKDLLLEYMLCNNTCVKEALDAAATITLNDNVFVN